MVAIDIMIDLIKRFEGCRLEAYKCPAGVWTIGYGYTHGVKEGDKWTQQQAESMLWKEAVTVMDQTLQTSPKLRSATQGQQAAIADFVYNCGLGNYKTSTLRRNVDAGDFNEARYSIMMWVKATVDGKRVKLPGLVKRRQAEADLL
jgi:lysozyme